MRITVNFASPEGALVPEDFKRRLSMIIAGVDDVVRAAPHAYPAAQRDEIAAALVALSERVHGAGFPSVESCLAAIAADAGSYPAVRDFAGRLAQADKSSRARARSVAADLDTLAQSLAAGATDVFGTEKAAALRAMLADAGDLAAAQTAWRDRRSPSKQAREFLLRRVLMIWTAAGGMPTNNKPARDFLALCARGVVPATEIGYDTLVRFLQQTAAAGAWLS